MTFDNGLDFCSYCDKRLYERMKALNVYTPRAYKIISSYLWNIAAHTDDMNDFTAEIYVNGLVNSYLLGSEEII